MKIDKDVFKLFEELQKNGIKTVEVNANGKIYHVEADVYEVFIKYCTESPEDFLTRIQPEDDDAASYQMSIYANRVIGESRTDAFNPD